MTNIRSFLVATMLGIGLVMVSVPYIPALIVFGPKRTVWLRRLAGYFLIAVTGCRLEIINPLMGWGFPVVFVANHQSVFDSLMISAAIPENFSIIAKKGLLKIPVFGSIVKRMGLIFIDRRNLRESSESIDLAWEKIKDETSALIFAEGTRTKTGEIGRFKSGAFLLARKSLAPIVPIKIKGSFECNPGGWRFRPGKLSITFGQPILPGEYWPMRIEEMASICRDRIIAM